MLLLSLKFMEFIKTNMKKIILLSTLSLLFPLSASAFATTTVPWVASTTDQVKPNTINGFEPALFVQATRTPSQFHRVTIGQATTSNFMALGSSTLQSYTAINSTTTSATSTNLFVSGLASTTALRANSVIFGDLNSSRSVTGSTTATNLLAGGATTTTLAISSLVHFLGLSASAGTPSSICQNAVTKEITVNAALTCTVSDEEQKAQIKSLNFSALDMIRKIQPVSFYYKDNLGRLRYGFGAQSVQKIDPRLADGYDKKGVGRSVDMMALISVNMKATQELDQKVQKLERDNAELQKMLKSVLDIVQSQQKQINSLVNPN